MPDLDLGPNDYRTKGPDGRWRIPDDPKLARNGFIFATAIVGFIWWNRADLSVDNLFYVTAGFAFAAGIQFATWLKNVY